MFYIFKHSKSCCCFSFPWIFKMNRSPKTRVLEVNILEYGITYQWKQINFLWFLKYFSRLSDEYAGIYRYKARVWTAATMRNSFSSGVCSLGQIWVPIYKNFWSSTNSATGDVEHVHFMPKYCWIHFLARGKTYWWGWFSLGLCQLPPNVYCWQSTCKWNMLGSVIKHQLNYNIVHFGRRSNFLSYSSSLLLS